MKTIAAQEIKRRGISAVDELLQEGPVQIIKQNRPRYVVLGIEAYLELVAGRSATSGPSAWDWLDKPVPGRASPGRSKADIDAALACERAAWDDDG